MQPTSRQLEYHASLRRKLRLSDAFTGDKGLCSSEIDLMKAVLDGKPQSRPDPDGAPGSPWVDVTPANVHLFLQIPAQEDLDDLARSSPRRVATSEDGNLATDVHLELPYAVLISNAGGMWICHSQEAYEKAVLSWGSRTRKGWGFRAYKMDEQIKADLGVKFG